MREFTSKQPRVLGFIGRTLNFFVVVVKPLFLVFSKYRHVRMYTWPMTAAEALGQSGPPKILGQSRPQKPLSQSRPQTKSFYSGSLSVVPAQKMLLCNLVILPSSKGGGGGGEGSGEGASKTGSAKTNDKEK